MRRGITLTFVFALAGLADTAFSLADEQKVCSIEGNTPVTIAVINRNQTDTFHIFWIDYKCNEVAKGTLTPGQRWDQRTFISHPWRVRDAKSGRLVREFVTNPATPVITFVP